MKYLSRLLYLVVLSTSGVVMPESIASASCVENAPGPYAIVVDVMVEQVSADSTAAIVRVVHLRKGWLDIKRFAIWNSNPTGTIALDEKRASPARIPPSAALDISMSKGKPYRLYARSMQRDLPRVYGVRSRLQIPDCSPSRPLL
jgi:hypothetical protein